MPRIELLTEIKADIKIVFDLSRSIDLHQLSTQHTQERAIAGKTSGLIELNDRVTWRAKHLGFYQTLTSEITEFDPPNYFVDEMVRGAFKRFRHEHYFSAQKDGTLMRDVFDYQSPLGLLGKLADQLFLEQYMFNFLEQRNQVIKQYAESKRWKEVLTKEG